MAETNGPDSLNLYVVYLGGDLVPGRLGEDHEVVLVVGADVKDARRRAKAKWAGHGRAHIDGVTEVRRVDGYDLVLRPGEPGDALDADPTYVAADGG